jgi:hypothetical protein
LTLLRGQGLLARSGPTIESPWRPKCEDFRSSFWPLKDGDSVYIKFNEADDGCHWTIKLDWAMQGYPSPIIRNLNLCNVNDITLTYDKTTDVTTANLR